MQLDGTVLAKIKLEVSNAERLDYGAETTGESPVAITTTNAETSLVLTDGVRTILGGLYEAKRQQQNHDAVSRRHSPDSGVLFTNFSNNDEKREIILSITPYIIKNVELPDADVATIWSGGEDNLKDGPNFGSFADLCRVKLKPQSLCRTAVTPASIMAPDDDFPPTETAVTGQMLRRC